VLRRRHDAPVLPDLRPDARRTERAARTPPELTYPKANEAVLVDTFCEPATGSNLLDALTTGLPGASALILPMHACWHDGPSCP
jgi:hypothetical protein